MKHSTDKPQEGELRTLIDEQIELAAARMPPLENGILLPDVADEAVPGGPSVEDVMLGNAEPTEAILEELAALKDAPAMSEEELARQALESGGADGDPSTPE